MDEFLREVLKQIRMQLVLTGDLTFNGEILSLREIAEKLEAVQEAGIPGARYPGQSRYRFVQGILYSGNDVAYTDNISKEDFRRNMLEFWAGGRAVLCRGFVQLCICAYG